MTLPNETENEINTEKTDYTSIDENAIETPETITEQPDAAEQSSAEIPEEQIVEEPSNDVNSENTETAAKQAEIIPEAPAVEEKIYRWSFEEAAAENKKKKKKSAKRGALIYALIVTLLFLICAGVLVYLLTTANLALKSNNPDVINSDRTVFIRETDKTSDELTLQEIYSKVLPSTVSIIKTTADGYGEASGFIYNTDGYIVTNYHVVQNALKITVRLYDGSEYPASVIGGDELSDVALIKINAGDKKLTAVEIGDSNDILVGDQVCAIGSPAGVDYYGTMTVGHVSYQLRIIKSYDSNGLVDKKMKYIQMDCLINHGNSGGPLCNMHGQVIGINTMKLGSDYEGMCFAIPMTGANKIIQEILTTGKYTGSGDVASKGVSLGISCVAVVKDVQCQAEGMTDWTPKASGLAVASISSEESSAYGYLQKYDIITEFNGVVVDNVYQVREILEDLFPGDTVTLKVYRDGNYIDVSFKLK